MQITHTKNDPLDTNKWRKIIDAWEISGESQKTYCERLQLNINTFTYARSKLLQKSKAQTKFVPLTIKNVTDNQTFPSPVIVLENPQGYKLHLSASLSLEQLTKIFNLTGWNNA